MLQAWDCADVDREAGWRQAPATPGGFLIETPRGIRLLG